MKNIILGVAFIGLLIGSSWGQELPRESQFASVKQRIGLTDITIEYSRPNVKKRELYGELVPYNEVWRLGANECSKFTTSSDIVFSKGVLKKGTYAIFATVNKKGGFILHFNTDFTQWGKSKYDKSKDVLRVQLNVKESRDFNESLLIGFKDLKVHTGTMFIKWGKTQVDLGIRVPTMKLAEDNIKAAVKKGEKLEEVYANAAEFYLDFAKSTRKAKKYADKSLKEKETTGGFYVMAAVLRADKKDKEAKKYLKDALSLAKKEESAGWQRFLNNKKTSWGY